MLSEVRAVPSGEALRMECKRPTGLPKWGVQPDAGCTWMSLVWGTQRWVKPGLHLCWSPDAWVGDPAARPGALALSNRLCSWWEAGRGAHRCERRGGRFNLLSGGSHLGKQQVIPMRGSDCPSGQDLRCSL